MEFDSVVSVHDIKKKYKGFELDVQSLEIPKGFATAIIGENGAGKTTLMDIMAGVKLDYKGSIKYFGKYTDEDRENNPEVKSRIGYTATGNYYIASWNLLQVKELLKLLFEDFNEEKYDGFIKDLGILKEGIKESSKKVGDLSDGNRMKLMLAGVLSRDTDLLIMDEPASPLDPLMRDKLCELLRNYLNEKEGEKSIIFSTHNVSDMENVTDYAVIVENGKVVERGFVDDLKEKYIYVKGDKEIECKAGKYMYSMISNSFGFEGLCLSENVDNLSGMDLTMETPSLSQIVISVMRENSDLYK